MRQLMKLFMALVVCLALLPAIAYAKGGHGHGDRDRDDRDAHHDKDKDHDRDHDRDDRGPNKRPPGWDKGKKVGWGNCNEPPGLAKKNGGCNNNVRHDRDHDRDDRDRHNTRTTRTWHGSTTASATTTTSTTHNTSTTKPVTTTKPTTTTKVYRGRVTSTKTYKTNHE